MDDLADQVSVEETGDSAGPALVELRRAIAAGLTCELVYVSPDGAAPTARTLDPYALAVSRGHWYAIGYCGTRQAVRVFRVDRIVSLQMTGREFTVPGDFNAEEFWKDGEVFRAEETSDVVINYRGKAASIMGGRPGAEEHSDGSVSRRRVVAEPEWVVRHVLGFGGEAVIEMPAEVRARVVAASDRISLLYPPGE